LRDLATGPYFVLAAKIQEAELCALDASCRLFRSINSNFWRELGSKTFYGIELEGEGTYESQECATLKTVGCTIDLKRRYRHFRTEAPKFRGQFNSNQITEVCSTEEVAYCNYFLRTDLLQNNTGDGVYLEIDVPLNADNLSLCVVDFDDGGKSSLTFSPDLGTVLRERKIQESPRRVRGAYIQPLAPQQGRFEGQLGLYIRGGEIAFFRRPKDERYICDNGMGPWETTGFIIGLQWAEGRRLTPCVAFGDKGMYRISITRLGSEPPVVPKRQSTSYSEAVWREMNWEAQPAEP
jgi:hypothetical protein